MKNIEKEEWTEVISAKNSWFDLRLSELWRYRDLVMLFVWRDFVSVYKQTILGPLWHIIQPLFTTITFTIVFGNIAQISTNQTPPFLFYMAGITIWNYFASCLTKTSNTFTANAGIFGKVYFPRMTVPVSVVISNILALLIQLGLFALFYLYYFFFTESNLKISWWILAVPYFAFLMGLLGLGFGIIISSLTTKYRDLAYLIGFGVQLLMYATPVIYPLSALSPKYQFIISLNPITPIVEGFKVAFFDKGIFDIWSLGYATIFALVTFLIGLGMFHHVEKSFMDTV
jgi:lipopolysaccharide transport system permease protein